MLSYFSDPTAAQDPLESVTVSGHDAPTLERRMQRVLDDYSDSDAQCVGFELAAAGDAGAWLAFMKFTRGFSTGTIIRHKLSANLALPASILTPGGVVLTIPVTLEPGWVVFVSYSACYLLSGGAGPGPIRWFVDGISYIGTTGACRDPQTQILNFGSAHGCGTMQLAGFGFPDQTIVQLNVDTVGFDLTFNEDVDHCCLEVEVREPYGLEPNSTAARVAVVESAGYNDTAAYAGAGFPSGLLGAQLHTRIAELNSGPFGATAKYTRTAGANAGRRLCAAAIFSEEG